LKITGYSNKALAAVARTPKGTTVKGIDSGQLEKLRRMLSAIEAAANVQALLSVPTWKGKRLKEPRNRYSLRVTGNFRLFFDVNGEEVSNVDLRDDH
jgi:plasmid maintenance system killer protein